MSSAQAEAERERRAKIISGEGEALAAAALGDASDTMMRPARCATRNLQSLVEIGVDKNATVVFPAPLMSTIGELGSFLAQEATAARLYTAGRLHVDSGGSTRRSVLFQRGTTKGSD